MTDQRFESVWDALEDTPKEAASLRLRADLLSALQEQLQSGGLTQREAAQRLNVTQPRISDLMRGRIERFSVETLVDMLREMGVEVEWSLRKAA